MQNLSGYRVAVYDYGEPGSELFEDVLRAARSATSELKVVAWRGDSKPDTKRQKELEQYYQELLEIAEDRRLKYTRAVIMPAETDLESFCRLRATDATVRHVIQVAKKVPGERFTTGFISLDEEWTPRASLFLIDDSEALVGIPIDSPRSEASVVEIVIHISGGSKNAAWTQVNEEFDQMYKKLHVLDPEEASQCNTELSEAGP